MTEPVEKPVVRVAGLSELSEEHGLGVMVEGKPIVVFLYKGEASAMDDVCPHMGASLSGGSVCDGVVMCPWHAWRFSVVDGGWLSAPQCKIPTYRTKIVGDDVMMESPR
ncbi:MAG: Rieske (2Fe-2S) protein [Planctomycetia bacterium]